MLSACKNGLVAFFSQQQDVSKLVVRRVKTKVDKMREIGIQNCA